MLIRKLFKKRKGSTESRDVQSEAEYKEEHRRIFRPTLETLVKNFLTKPRFCEIALSLNNLAFLDNIGFFKEFKATYPNVELSKDTEKGKLNLRGRGEEFEDAYENCSQKLRDITVKSLRFDDEKIWDVIADAKMQSHIKSVFTSDDIKAQVHPDCDGMSVKITAIGVIELQKATRILVELVEKQRIQIPEHVDRYSEGEKIQKFVKGLESSRALKIYFQPSNSVVEIVGVSQFVAKALRELQAFFVSLRIKQKSFAPPNSTPDIKTFLRIYFDHFIKKEEREFQSLNISVQQIQSCSGYQITMTGAEKNFSAAERMLQRMVSNITQKDIKFTYPGLIKLFDEKNGVDEVKRIEQKRKVLIRITPGLAHVSKSKPQNSYARYNFATKEGVQVSFKIGRIENEQADVLVNSAHSNLNHLTACGKALQDQGGISYTEACKLHTNIPMLDIVCTSGGNLPCKYVIHAICCHWNKEDEQKSEKALGDLIRKIFVKCIELNVTSVALPTIGAGKHGYPEDIVIKILQREIKTISCENTGLKKVSVIVFEGKMPHFGGCRSQATSKQNENDTNYTSFGTAEEIQVHFVGYRNDIDHAISDMKAFVEMKRDKRTIEGIGNIVENNKVELEKLSAVHRVRITSSSAGAIDVEGMKDDVTDFFAKFTEIQRQYLFTTDDIPSFWDVLPEGKVVDLVNLLPSSSEYREILMHFKMGFTERAAVAPTVRKIERIQNPDLFRLYLAKKKAMGGRENEMRLFHGTDVKNTDAINGNNFNRSLAGSNGVLFGNGVYFTNRSSFAFQYCADELGRRLHLSNRYSLNGNCENSAPSATKWFKMYVVKVLVGEYTKGAREMIQPPKKNDLNNPTLLFDSVVNNVENPSIFVLFQDHQYYPEYLITLEHIC